MRSTVFANVACALALLSPAVFANGKGASTGFDAGALRVEQRGKSGRPVILIPGLSSGAWVWADTAARLEKNHQVYLLTLPGFDGRKPVEGTTFETLVQDLATLIEVRKLDRPVLVGHSLGGTLSLALAAGHSKLIGGVIAVDGLPVFPGTENVTGDRSALAQQVRAQFANQTPEQFAAGQQAYMRQIGVLDAAQADKLALLSGRSDPLASGELAGQVMQLDLRPRLKDIAVPVVEISPFNAPDLAAFGVDEAGKTNYYRGLLGGIADLEVVSVSPARHFVMFDQPEKFAAALDGALAKVVELSATE
jgi:pimeloyl-ACP methyl ester carboxylesterase